MMIRNQRIRIIKTAASVLLAIVLSLAMLQVGPVSAFADSENAYGNDTITVGKDANDLFDPPAPPGYDPNDDSNPFGYGKGVPFRMYEDAELFQYVTDTNLDKSPRCNIFEQYKKNDGSSLFEDKSWDKHVNFDIYNESTYKKSSIGEHWFVDAVPLDIGYTGDRHQRTCIAFTGARQNDSGNFDVDVWVYDTKSEKYSNVLKLGEITNIQDWRSGDETFFYQVRNFISLTAGDYDNDSKDTLVVYGAYKDGPSLSEVKVDGDGNSAPSISLTASSDSMLHKKYLDNYGKFKDDSSADGHMKLGCSLASGDVTGDKIDDLIAVSYTQTISDGLVQSLGDEIVMPQLAMNPGAKGKSGDTLLAGNSKTTLFAGGDTKDSTYMPGSTERLTSSTPTVTVAKTGISGENEILIGGYEEYIYRFKEDNTVNDTRRNRNEGSLLVYHNEKDGLQRIFADTGDIATALKKHGKCSRTMPRLLIAAVSLNGSANPDKICVGGVFYDLSTRQMKSVYTIPCLDHTYTAGDFESGDSIEELYVDTPAVASLIKTGGNYDSLVFSLVALTKQNGPSALSPYAYAYRAAVAGPIVNPESSRVTGYYGTAKDNLEPVVDEATGFKLLTAVRFDLTNKGLDKANLVLCPVDYVDDGLVIRYSGKNYVYADPRVLSVLQASPGFSQIGQTLGTTEYNFSNRFSYSDETSKTISYGIGLALQLTTDFVEASLRVGYSNETRNWCEKEFSEEHTISFEADHDSVVLYRTPIIYYMYDVWDPKTNTWNEQGFDVSYVRPGEYVQVSISDYNDFVTKYNNEGIARFKKKGVDPSKFTQLEKIGDDKYLGCEGDPTKYFQTDQTTTTPEGYGLIDEHVHALGYNGGSDSTELVTGTSVTTGKEQNEGVSVDFDVLGGPEVFKVGIYASFEAMFGHAVSTTEENDTGVRTTVANLDEGQLLAEGYTDQQIRAHFFNWQPAKWDSGLHYTYTDSNSTVGLRQSKQGLLLSPESSPAKTITRSVPVYGYVLTNVHKPLDLSEAEVTLSSDTFEYNGKDQKPSVTVKLDGQTLPENDYTISYMCDKKEVTECVEPNTYAVVVKGAGANINSASAAFSITAPKKTDISGAKVTVDPESAVYNGSAQNPSVDVTLDGKKLTAGTDYTIEYMGSAGLVSDCIHPDTYSIVAEGTGDYTGSANAAYTINKAANTLSVKGRTITVSRKKIKNEPLTLSGSDVFTVNNAKGSVLYEGTSSVGDKITLDDDTGDVTIAKGMKAGIYTILANVSAAGNGDYEPAVKPALVTIIVKLL